MKMEFLVTLIENGNAQDIGRQQIRCELDAMKIGIDRACQCLRHGRFTCAGDIFQQHMATAEKGSEQSADGDRLALNDLFDIGGNSMVYRIGRHIGHLFVVMFSQYNHKLHES
jgi:hypothetical protein